VEKYLKEIVSFLVILTILANLVSYYKSSDLNKDSLNLGTATLINGILYDIPKNKPVLVHFWTTWCPVCTLEASNIQTLSENYEVITIAVDSGSQKEIQEYLTKNDLNFKVINDSNKYYARKFNISVFPTTFIYDKNQNIVFSEVGYSSTFGLYLRMLWASF
jgi:thiol-disulfide isomerase/thioredoxin